MIRLRVECEEEGDLSDLLVMMVVRAGSKNPYRIGFPKTDRSGRASLSRDDFIGQFTDHWEGALMDHDGTPDTAGSVVRVELYDPRWSLEHREAALAWPLLTHERTKWRSREEQYRYRTSSRNLEFVASPVEVNLDTATEIVLPLKRRTGERR
jgi:hypothetical protein